MPRGQSRPEGAPGQTHTAPPKVWRPRRVRAVLVCGSLVFRRREAALLSASPKNLAVGRGAEARQPPRRLRPLHPRDSRLRFGDMTPGPHPHPRSSSRVRPQCRRPASECPHFPRGRPGPPGAATGTSGGLGWGRGGVPARSEKKGRGAGSLSRPASWNCPRAPGAGAPASARNRPS